MMSTKNPPSSRHSSPAPTPAAVPKPSAETFAAGVTTTAQKLIQECSEVRVRISWFGTSTKVEESVARDMMAGTEAQRNALAISKRLLTSKSKALVAVKQARKAIDDHVAAWTVPMLALQEADTGGASEPNLRKDAGVRLIQKKDMAAFDERIEYLKGVLYAAAQQLDASLPEILDEERQRLGKLFKIDDYPKSIADLIGVEVWYKPTGIDINWEKLCPKIYEREARAARVKFEAVVENAAVEWSQAFVKFVQQVLDQLGNRVRIRPMMGSEWAKYNEAEIVEKVTHEQDDTVPIGEVALNLRINKEGRAGKSDTMWLDPMPLVTFRDVLRPYEVGDERKKIYASTIDNLKIEMDKFLNVGAMLGPYQEVVTASVEKVKNMLGQANSGMDSESIAKQLRDGAYMRNQMKSVLADVANVVAAGIVEGKAKRRSINRRTIGDKDDE